MLSDELTVAEAADALGTTPQTVRTLLRKGELRGRKQRWGSRYVWVPSREGVDDFLSEYGRLDGHRRPRPSHHPVPEEPEEPEEPQQPIPFVVRVKPPPADEQTYRIPTEILRARMAPRRPSHRPLLLRARGRASVVVFLVGVPLVLAYSAAPIRADALWFQELGQLDVYRRILEAKVELFLLVATTVALFVGANLAVALRRNGWSRADALGISAASLATASIFGSCAEGHWQTFLLWQHRQTFGSVDPLFGRDIGFFVFTLPFELMVADVLLWLIGFVAGYVAFAYWVRGSFAVQPLRASHKAKLHFAILAATFLLVLAWRLRLEQYALELSQPSSLTGQAFSGANYVDVHVRMPALTTLSVLSVELAISCVVAALLARRGHRRAGKLVIGTPAVVLALAVVLAGALIPALVQRYVVDPTPLTSEQPYLERSILATRAGLGLDQIDVQRYSPTGSFNPADFSSLRPKLKDVLIWDPWILKARMRDLVTDTPYFSPDDPSLDVTRVDGRRQLTVVSARDLDLGALGSSVGWTNQHFSYTHGLGLIRFSGTDVEPGRQPQLLDSGLGVRQPRIYFGDRPQSGGGRNLLPAPPTGPTPPAAAGPWVLANTHRPEVDIPAAQGSQTTYHYHGDGGIRLSSWVDRAVFALKFGSLTLLRSHDITSHSRLLLHQDLFDRLHTLAPFIQWDSTAVPLTANGRIVFVVNGYTTSQNYPYAERIALGGSRVTYARASVVATVDAYSGRVNLYLTNPAEPIARAWAEIFPSLFHPQDQMPAELRRRLRYPADLFGAQATAYQTFHTTRPDLFASKADAWSRPIALSGPIDVAGNVTFDESDEDDLRLTMAPTYTYSSPPGSNDPPQLVLGTYYSPHRGQNLVASLSGWIDPHGHARLAARSLPRDPVTLGPAQVSRLVFSTPRVSNLLGLQNLELRDLSRSSLDTVLLGNPHLLFLPSGILQIQSLYEGSRGPGAARLIGVTAFLNGRAGLGSNIERAVRQALNKPPGIHVSHPATPIVVGRRVNLQFQVENARREVVTITTAAGTRRTILTVESGTATVPWIPPATGRARVRVEVDGLDGTRVARSTSVDVLSHPPTIQVLHGQTHAFVGRPVRVSFKVANGLQAVAEVSTRDGIVFTRRYQIRHGVAAVDWKPDSAGKAVLRIRVRGHQRQTVTSTLHIVVAPNPQAVTHPTVTFVHVPDVGTVGRPSALEFQAARCSGAVARIEGPDGRVQVWRFTCPAAEARFTWTPKTPGTYVLTAIAHRSGDSVQATTRLTARPAS